MKIIKLIQILEEKESRQSRAMGRRVAKLGEIKRAVEEMMINGKSYTIEEDDTCM